LEEELMADVKEMVKYEVTAAAIAELRERYMALRVKDETDAVGCKVVHGARIIVKNLRVSVEHRRVELKAEALAFGKRVDDVARSLREPLEEIEAHLDAEERIVTDAKMRAEAAKLLKDQAEERARKEAEEARIKAEHEAEAKRLSDERERLAKEDAKLKAVEAAQQAERNRLVAVQVEQERRAKQLEREQNERDHRAEVEKAQKEAAEAARVETEARIKREAAAEEEERKRVAAMMPDAHQIRAYGKRLAATCPPPVKTQAAQKFLDCLVSDLLDLAARCEKFGVKGGE
jgi:hypothetical protein